MSQHIDLLSRLEERKKKELIQSSNATIFDNFIFALLLAAVGIIPLIVLGSYSTILPPVISDNYYVQLKNRGDFFSYYKAVALMWGTAIIALLFILKTFIYHIPIRKTILNYFVGGAILALLLSSILSPAKTISVVGLANRAEGSATWICYLVLFFIAMNTAFPKKVVHYVLFAFVPFTLFNLWMMLTYFYGSSAFNYEWVRTIVGSTLPNNMTVPKNSAIVGTLNQWNYMSGMFSILTVIYLAASIFEKKTALRIFYFVMSIVSVAILLMSISNSGFLVVCIMSVMILAYTIRYNVWKQALIIYAAFTIIFFPLLHVLSTENSRVFRESLGIVFDNPYDEEATTTQAEEKTPAKDDPSDDSATYTLPTLPEPSMSMLSGRGYIWEKTLQSAIKRPILGYGMDTNLYFFPHYNIDARAGFLSEVPTISKPHSIYIGLIQGVGFIGILPFICLILTVIILSVRPLVIKQGNFTMPILFGFAFVAYSLQGIVNDSVVGISTPLWIIGGLACALLLPRSKRVVDGI